jgi:hypothetical protein
MKKIFYLFIILLFSCNSKTNLKNNVESAEEEFVYKEPIITGGKYFEYDELIHYKNDFDENKIGELYDNQDKSDLDSLKMGVILNDTPKSINDTTFLKKLETFGYKKSIISKTKFNKIDEIFTEKKHSEVLSAACVYVYRDILIFKRNSKIIGIAKICFDCGDSEIVGTKANTNEFGQSGDFDTLYEILNKK